MHIASAASVVTCKRFLFSTWLEPNSLCGFEMEFALPPALPRSTNLPWSEYPFDRFDLKDAWKEERSPDGPTHVGGPNWCLPCLLVPQMLQLCGNRHCMVWFSILAFTAGFKMFQEVSQGKCAGRLFQTWASGSLPFLRQGFHGFSVLTYVGQKVKCQRNTCRFCYCRRILR